MLPKLALKLVRIPAMFGGATVAGVAYIQYQAHRTSKRARFQAAAANEYL